MRTRIALRGVVAAALTLGAVSSHAIMLDPFPGDGFGGSFNGQNISIRTGGDVFALESYVNVAGADLNGGFVGTAAQLGTDSLPSGLDLDFSFSLLDGNTDLVLTYKFSNNTGAATSDIALFLEVDADIDFGVNGISNEVASTSGALASGQGFEVSSFPQTNALNASLSNANAFPAGSPGQVAMALSFDLGPLGIGEMSTVEFMLSEDGDSLGSFAITQSDTASSSPTQITFSGAVVPPDVTIPEPASFALAAAGMLGFLRRRRQSR